MDCPRDNVEMLELTEGEDRLLFRCGECEGIWLDAADLNRILLHAGLPTLESMGGRADPEEDAGECPACSVGLLAVQSHHKRNPLVYETCESCGGIWLEGADFEADRRTGSASPRGPLGGEAQGESAAVLRGGIVAFFRSYSDRPATKNGR
jgi:Zn-finger nucleic acid-binding protein